MKITPQWIATFETNIQTLILDSWTRMRGHLVYDKFMETRPSGTLRELYFWLIESARIRDQGQGGNKRFDDIAANFFEITNGSSGDGLRLTKFEIEDNMMRAPNLKGMPALDYAANWARQMGGSAAYWPQEKFFELLLSGETAKGYDDVAFFSASHPVNPYAPSAGNYRNLYTGSSYRIDEGVSLDVAAKNLAFAIANVRLLTQPNGKPRNLVVRHCLVGPLLQKRVNEILDTKLFTLNGIENVVSRYGIEPVVASELTSATDYYLGCEMLPGEGGPFIYQDREPYVLTSYTLETLADLQRRKEYEWSFDGRNAAAFGHPYLFHKFKQ